MCCFDSNVVDICEKFYLGAGRTGGCADPICYSNYFLKMKSGWMVYALSSCIFPQIAGSYRGSNFSKGGIVLANWPTSGCCSECCAGCCPGCCCGCCPGCSGSCLPLGGVTVLSRVLCRGAVQGAVRSAPDHVCHWAVSGCCPGCCSGCSGSCLPLGGVRVLSRVQVMNAKSTGDEVVGVLHTV